MEHVTNRTSSMKAILSGKIIFASEVVPLFNIRK